MASKPLPKDPKIDYIRELILTFSNKPSLFSSKKIERFIVFNVFLVLSVVFVVKKMHEMSSMEFIEVLGMWLIYGGYNSLLNSRRGRGHGRDNDQDDPHGYDGQSDSTNGEGPKY